MYVRGFLGAVSASSLLSVLPSLASNGKEVPIKNLKMGSPFGNIFTLSVVISIQLYLCGWCADFWGGGSTPLQPDKNLEDVNIRGVSPSLLSWLPSATSPVSSDSVSEIGGGLSLALRLGLGIGLELRAEAGVFPLEFPSPPLPPPLPLIEGIVARALILSRSK
jgi:hypothetical protein